MRGERNPLKIWILAIYTTFISLKKKRIRKMREYREVWKGIMKEVTLKLSS